MKKWLSLFVWYLLLGGIACGGTIGSGAGGFSGGAAGGGGGGGGTIAASGTTIFHIIPNATDSTIQFDPPVGTDTWTWDSTITGGKAITLTDTTRGFQPIICWQGGPLGTLTDDACDQVDAHLSLRNENDGGYSVFTAPTGIGGTPLINTVPPAQVAGGYWFDAAGNGVLTENVPILTSTSASLNHGGVNIGANSCENESPTTVAGTTTAMDCTASPTGDPGTAFTWAAICGSGTVTIRICNISASAATPTASTYNIRVIK